MDTHASSKLGHVLMLLLLLSFLLHHTKSTLPSDHEELSITGRRIMAYYKHDGAIGTPPSRSGRGGGHGKRMMPYYNPNAPTQTPTLRSRRGGGGHNGRKLMGIYRPNGDIYTGPSNSGHGGGHIHQHSSP
ncbi:uncharacterized protein LOC9301430 isoform X1 [Arabidopsis lyrata subsp. lyrata]|uniref:uncharacterized protein LOC9301430 isoform X1 n=2 Tax=Arabidopsis lyrata subsp. lyrata TaxID=81972 RepID=UPI000A29E1C3|nr:uncharacterized protein LOC9301430 isoform X1 [Arabidopsis lyrata subsp. lyrata]|eukprot:XP_020871269.1 uncharacterized protein LOC9301430 isoform X1 [Arabidopsis lyrata subsp. lyrata]